jgi:hypothetical protein
MATPIPHRTPMIRKKRTLSSSTTNAPSRAVASSSLPQWLSLISLPFVAMSASALLYTLGAPFVDVQFTAVSREPNILLGGALGIWRVLELWIAWYLGFDGKSRDMHASSAAYCDIHRLRRRLTEL